ncbi:MAG: putative colanic acid biosynthesis UDP-glucose lipid carrier transferase [Flavobacteriales bacterium]
MHRGYSNLLKPIMTLIDLSIINGVMYYMNSDLYLDLVYILFFNVAWMLISFNNQFYNIYRNARPSKAVYLIIAQFSTFFLAYFTYFGIFKEGDAVNDQLVTLLLIYSLIVVFKLSIVVLLKGYRIAGGNYRNVIIIGEDESVSVLRKYFNSRLELGYRLKGYFSDTAKNEGTFLGQITESFNFALENNIDEIYLSMNSISKEQIKEFEIFADNNLITLKLVPDYKGVFRKMEAVHYYDYLPVISIRKQPLDDVFRRFMKRSFDLLFSAVVIVFLLTWLIPIIALLIRWESKGPIFFKQKRDGLNGISFGCYKFRSMRSSEEANKIQATKEDARITKMGAFMRKTSIDELPQFINVLLGNMSVVGPRPHMLQHTQEFSKSVNKYMVRHFVKPGITGLAQIKGYRGEIKVKSDINNRVKFDVFYLENWSLILDIRIVLQTVSNAISGEENAY